jgi:hypothetical protein
MSTDERTIAAIKSRKYAGESIESLALDYGMTDRQITCILEPQWAIEVRSTNAEFYCDMNRAIVRNIQSFDVHAWVRLQTIESTETSSIMVAAGDLSSLQWLAGEHRRVKKQDDGKMHSNWCQVEIYPLGKPPIAVQFRSWPAPGVASAEPPTITGIAETGTITTPYEHSARKEIKSIVVDILSSRQKTDRKVLNWVLRPGQEYGQNRVSGQRLTLDDYLAFFDGDFRSTTPNPA